jgi:hypothetical protein
MPSPIVRPTIATSETCLLGACSGCWGTLPGGGKPGVDAGVDLAADLVEERVHDRISVIWAELAVGLGGCPDLVRRKR